MIFLYVCIVLLILAFVQPVMNLRITSAVVALGLFCAVLPSRAQLAYVHFTVQPQETLSTDPEEVAKATATKVVHGIVQDEKGALPGATVWLHGTRTIVVTNAEGEFELRVPADTKIVELTCAFGGLQEEVVRLAAVQALGSVYLLRPKRLAASQAANN